MKRNHVWRVFWCWVIMLVKDWHGRFLLDLDLSNWLKFLVLSAKYFRGVLFPKINNLVDLGYRGFIVFLVVDWVCCRFLIVKRIVFGENWSLHSVGWRPWKCVREKRGRQWCKIKAIDRCYLGFIVKLLHCINCLNPLDTNCVTFWYPNLHCDHLLKLMKWKTLQACSLKHCIQEPCLLFCTNWTHLKYAGEVILHPWLCVYARYQNFENLSSTFLL